MNRRKKFIGTIKNTLEAGICKKKAHVELSYVQFI